MHFSLLGFQVWRFFVFGVFFYALKPEEAVKPHSIGELVTVAELIVAHGLTFSVRKIVKLLSTCVTTANVCHWEFIWGKSVMANPVMYNSQQCLYAILYFVVEHVRKDQVRE